MEQEKINNVDELKAYESNYSDDKLSNKISSAFSAAGEKVIRLALLLYNVLKSDQVSIKAKSVIVGALGYFILPLDLIPDIIPVLGFTDDLTALTLAYKAVKDNITPEIEQKTQDKINSMFKKRKK